MVRAVIFDMDGTLFDTEAMYGRGWMAAGLSREQYLQVIGRSRPVNDAALVSWGFDVEEVRRKRDLFVKQELEQKGLPVKPGALKTLEWLAGQGIAAAVATSSPLSLARLYMELSGLGPYFTRILSGADLEKGKPDPEIFLSASRALGIPPAECMVVEDSFNGVRAGVNAGMITVMVPDQVPPDEEMRAAADAILPSLSELPDFITQCNGG